MNIIAEKWAVGSGAALRNGSSSTKIMRLLVAPAPRNTDSCYVW
jgi:hypothetical protein